ncbi:peptidoglycan-associated lipoprotein Pal [bacterium]|nr:peptidoglycan-associated lipoprotein Pal [bacterium]
MKQRLFPSLFKTLLPLLIVAALMTSCKTNRPKKWYEFWLKEAKPSTVYSPPEIVLPPPPDIEPFGLGDTTPLGENMLDDTGSLREVRPVATEASVVSELQTVHFAYDSYSLSPESQRLLEQNAQWVQEHPGLTVQIEGHCDERGSIEYNLNLGQKRASAVREYLVRMGVDPNRLTTISYGEERMLDSSGTDEAHAQNRRAQFLIY